MADYTKPKVSIHAPAWGATSVTRSRLRINSRFQFTHPRGVRQRKALALYLQGLKQKEVAERTGADVTEIYLLTYRFRAKVRTAVGYYARRIN